MDRPLLPPPATDLLLRATGAQALYLDADGVVRGAWGPATLAVAPGAALAETLPPEAAARLLRALRPPITPQRVDLLVPGPEGRAALSVELAPAPDGGAHAVVLDRTAELAERQRLANADRLAALGALSAQVIRTLHDPLTVLRTTLDQLEDAAVVVPAGVRAEAAARGEPAASALLGTPWARAAAELPELSADLRAAAEALRGALGRVQALAQTVEGWQQTLPADRVMGGVAARPGLPAGWALRIGPAAPASVRADPERLVGLLAQLAAALARAGDPTGGEVALWAEAGEDGVGFVLAAPTCRPLDPGPTASALVLAWGGALTVAAGTAGATRVTVRLPTVSAAPERRGPRIALVPLRARVLLLEPDPLVSNLARRALGADLDLVHVGSAEDARRAIAADPDFDAVVVDRMSAAGFTDWLRVQHPALAAHLVELVPEGTPPGERLLSRPLSPERLRERLRAVLAA